MTSENPADEGKEKRAQPRTAASLEVDVEVAGARRRLMLVSRDISPGGIFLRTDAPAPVFKRVRVFLEQADGAVLEVSGEVVRSVSPEQAKAKGQPPGMAVAFDEASRKKTSQFQALVEALASGAVARPPREAPTAATPDAVTPDAAPDAEDDAGLGRSAVVAKADSLLDELDALLHDDEPKKAPKASVAAPPKPAPPPPPPEKPPPIKPRAAARPPIPDLDEFEVPLDVAPEVTDVSGAFKVLGTSPASPVDELRKALEDYRGSLQGSTHYDVLLLARAASQEEVKQAFIRLVRRLKPRVPSKDLPPDLARQLAQVLDRIRKASDTLGHPERRKAYDYVLSGDNGN